MLRRGVTITRPDVVLRFGGVALLLVMVACFTLSVPAPAQSTPPFSARDLVGEWDSGACSRFVRGPSEDVSYIRRRYLFTETTYSVRYTYFSDEACAYPLFTAHLSGRYELGSTAAARGARYADVHLDRILLTVETPALLARANTCGDRPWEVGVQQDVTEKGCLAFKPKAACGMDYDLAALVDGVFFAGFRTADMCRAEGRQSVLQTTGGARRLKAN